jgi:preprotein translocase subunit YajC
MHDFLSALLTLAQTEAPAGEAPANPMQSYIFMLALIAAAFYFIILRPQSRERKQREQQLNALGRGDHIVTIGGLHGIVTRLDKAGKTVELELAKNLRITINRSAVATITKQGKDKGLEEETSS